MNQKNKLINYFLRLGKYHILLTCILQISILISNYHLVTFSFQKRRPEAICILKNSNEMVKICDDESFCNSADYERKILINSSLNNWALKFNLYCENAIYFDYLSSVIFLSTLTSSLVLSPIADYFGRKITFRLEISLLLIGNLFMFFSGSLSLFFFGVILCFLGNHITIVSTVLFKEFFTSDNFAYTTSLMNILFSIFGVLISFYISYFNDIQFLFLAEIIVIKIVSLISFRIIMESPSWLMEKETNNPIMIVNLNYLLEFDNVENKDIIMNEFELILEDLKNDVEFSQYTSQPYDFFKNIRTLFLGNAKNRFNFTISVYLWFFNQIIFYSLLLNLDIINKKIPFSTEIFFCVNIIANASSGFISNSYGRKPTMQLSAIISCIFSFIIYFIFEIDNFIYLKSVVFFLFTLFNFICASAVYFYVQELFESNVLTTAVAYSKIPSKMVLILFPFVLNANQNIFFLIISGITLVVPIMLIFCEETLNSNI